MELADELEYWKNLRHESERKKRKLGDLVRSQAAKLRELKSSIKFARVDVQWWKSEAERIQADRDTWRKRAEEAEDALWIEHRYEGVCDDGCWNDNGSNRDNNPITLDKYACDICKRVHARRSSEGGEG